MGAVIGLAAGEMAGIGAELVLVFLLERVADLVLGTPTTVE